MNTKAKKILKELFGFTMFVAVLIWLIGLRKG
jgi:hypothetical protein